MLTPEQIEFLRHRLFQHKGNGQVYRFVGNAVSATNGETDGQVLVLYRREPAELGKLPYARTITQFMARFTPVVP